MHNYHILFCALVYVEFITLLLAILVNSSFGLGNLIFEKSVGLLRILTIVWLQACWKSCFVLVLL